MAHKTKINGTTHSITGGGLLVNGTKYKIKEGKTKIAGTSKTIPFGIKDLTNTYWKLTNYYSTTNYVLYDITFSTRPEVGGTTLNGKSFYWPLKFEDSYYDINCFIPGISYASDVTYQTYYRYSGYINGQGWGTFDAGYYSSEGLMIHIYYQYIHITGGTDATNPTLISELQAHATQCNSSWNPI